ncbi:MAG: hypothetical protein WCP77_05815 [Roseococcus sp.]
MLPACESPSADGPPGSASERAASLLRSFSQIRSFATVEDPVLLGQALGATIRMARDTPEFSEAYISDDPRVPNGSWVRRARPDGSTVAGVSLTPQASGLCITFRALVDHFGRRARRGTASSVGWIYDDNIALSVGSWTWPVVVEPGATLHVGVEFLHGERRCASYLHLSVDRSSTRGGE